jgi:hypothetical protein
MTLIRSLTLLGLLALSAAAQVNVAASEAISGAVGAAKTLTKGFARNAAGIAVSIPVTIGTAVLSGTVAGASAFTGSLVSGTGKSALSAGAGMFSPGVAAAKDLGVGFAKAALHLSCPVPRARAVAFVRSHIEGTEK